MAAPLICNGIFFLDCPEFLYFVWWWPRALVWSSSISSFFSSCICFSPLLLYSCRISRSTTSLSTFILKLSPKTFQFLGPLQFLSIPSSDCAWYSHIIGGGAFFRGWTASSLRTSLMFTSPPGGPVICSNFQWPACLSLKATTLRKSSRILSLHCNSCSKSSSTSSSTISQVFFYRPLYPSTQGSHPPIVC